MYSCRVLEAGRPGPRAGAPTVPAPRPTEGGGAEIQVEQRAPASRAGKKARIPVAGGHAMVTTFPEMIMAKCIEFASTAPLAQNSTPEDIDHTDSIRLPLPCWMHGG